MKPIPVADSLTLSKLSEKSRQKSGICFINFIKCNQAFQNLHFADPLLLFKYAAADRKMYDSSHMCASCLP